MQGLSSGVWARVSVTILVILSTVVFAQCASGGRGEPLVTYEGSNLEVDQGDVYDRDAELDEPDSGP